MIYTPEPYKIKEIKDFTKDVKLFKVKTNLDPHPGQFVEVSIPGIGECPLASCSYDKNHIDLLTRKAGSVTSMMFKLKKGDSVFIRGPYGQGFPLDEMKNKNLIMIAGGTGIAPITSLINYVEKNRNDFGEVYIYFGFRNENYVLLKEKIKKWNKKFKVVVTLDKKLGSKLDIKCEKGFVHEIMGKHKPCTGNTMAFLCGPEIMMKCATEKLNGFGLKNDKIYWSMERRMECAIGNCGRCLIQDVYVCKDGPVFKYNLIKPKLENEYSNDEKT